MKTHHHHNGSHSLPTCGRVPGALAKTTADWAEVSCKWCLKERRPEPLSKEEQARLLLEAIKNPTPLQVSNLFAISWEATSEEFTCPRCEAQLERSRGLMISGPWAGSVRCTKCDYRDSVLSYLGKSMVQVQPMPPGAVLVYDREPVDGSS